ncbi:MAG: O-methyltransferase [Aggregatilineales bacterium]
MNLNQALHDIAEQFDLNADDLITYAAEDDIGGWDNGAGGWAIGSLWSVEGKVLYALIRALKPAKVLELGTHTGCSAAHIAAALLMNGTGKLTCVDMNENAGGNIPDDYRSVITFKAQDALDYISKSRTKWDFIYEDLLHTVDQVSHVWSNAKLATGGMLVSHDAMHFNVGDAVQAGIAESGKSPAYYLIAPADCGLAIWQNQ